MSEVTDLIAETDTAAGRGVTTALVVVIALVVGFVATRVASRRGDDAFARYYLKKLVRYTVVILAVIAIGIVWRAFAGRAGLVLGLAAAGLAFAMQEVIGAIAGWVNILSGRIYRIGDRVELAGVQGDVVDITPLRTKVMEIGDPTGTQTWVRGRQLTGRLVAISNKKTFTEPVFNYSTAFEFVWEEISVPVAYSADTPLARRILEEELRAITDQETVDHAMDSFVSRYPVHRAEIEPRVFGTMTDDYLQLAARFPVQVRTSRAVKDELTRRVLDRFREAGIEVASTTQDVTVRPAESR